VRPLVCAAAILASLAAVALAAPTGEARTAVPGDGCLVIDGGFGNVTISLTRGLIFGRVTSISSITIEDVNPADNATPKVYGAGSMTVLADGRIKYTGNQNNAPIRFKSQGAVKLRISDATQLALSVVGKGYAFLSSGTFDVSDNLYSVDSTSFCQDNFQPIPPPGAKPVKASISSPTS
jgi:hypothetical protein